MSIRWLIKCLVVWNIMLSISLFALFMDYYAEKWETHKVLYQHTEIATEAIHLIASYHEYMMLMLKKPDAIRPDTIKYYIPKPDSIEVGS